MNYLIIALDSSQIGFILFHKILLALILIAATVARVKPIAKRQRKIENKKFIAPQKINSHKNTERENEQVGVSKEEEEDKLII